MGLIRMLHWNIHSWRDDHGEPNADAVAGLIRDTGPDAVSLVEVQTSWGDASPLEKLAESLGYHWIFVPALEYTRDGESVGYGNALLTRLPVLGVQQWRVHSPERYAGTEPTEPRTVAWARVDARGEPIWIGSTHLPASSEDDRARALGRLAVQLDRLPGPWLACGDYNTTAGSWLDQLPAVTFSPDPPKATFPAARARRAIDYCVASPGVQADARVLRVKGSDHRPVLVSARFGEDTPALERPRRRGRRWLRLPRRR